MELPHIGVLPAGTHTRMKSSSMRWAAASVMVEAFTRSISPDLPWVDWFHLSMASSTASGW